MLALALALLAASAAAQQGDWQCRIGAGSRHNGCGLPYQLSNFQGHFACRPEVKVGRPRTLEELAAQVAKHPRVKAVGVGGSWAPDLYCAGTDGAALNGERLRAATEVSPGFLLMC